MTLIDDLEPVLAGPIGEPPPLGSAGWAAQPAMRASNPDSWSQRISHSFVPLTAEPVGGGPFAGSLRQIDRGPLKLARIDGSPQRVVRGREELARSRGSDMYLNIQLSGEGCTQAGEQATRTAIGSGVLVSSETAFALSFDQPFSQLCVTMPAPWLSTRMEAAAGELTGRPVDMATPLGGIVQAAVSALLRASNAAESEACCDLLAQALRGVVCASAQQGHKREPSRLLARLMRLIQHRLNDPLFTPAIAAAELGCSLSTLHLHCQNGGQSFGNMLQSARLDAAAMQLRHTSRDPGRVGMIAYACGFGDPSHFARSFRARFGLTPSKYC